MLDRIKNTDYERQLEERGYAEDPSKYSDKPYIISQSLLEDGKKWRLPEGELDIKIPVHILHGFKDVDVPIEISQKLCAQLTSTQLSVTFIPDGDHRLSREVDIAILRKIILNMAKGALASH